MTFSSQPLRILLADDHQIVIEGTRKLLEGSREASLVHLATTVRHALQLLETTPFDILITDYAFLDGTGMDLVRAGKAHHPALKIIVLSMHDDAAIIQDLLAHGADGFVLKTEAHEQLLRALEQVREGRSYLSPEVSSALVQSLREPTSSHPLSPRETEILKLIVQEFTSKQIAERLYISELTVETHRKNILRKTGCTSLVGLVKYAYAQGIVT